MKLFSYFFRRPSHLIVVPSSGGLADQMRSLLFAIKLRHDYPGIEIHFDLWDFLNYDSQRKFFSHAGGTTPIELSPEIFRYPSDNPEFHNFFHLHNYDIEPLLKKLNISFYAYNPDALYWFVKNDQVDIVYNHRNIASGVVIAWNKKMPCKSLFFHKVIDFKSVPVETRLELIPYFRIKYDLHAKEKKMLEEIKNTKNSICLHVRRGDYICPPHNHKATSINYVISAASEIMTAEKWNTATLFLFCEDTNWAHTLLKEKINGVVIKYPNINNASSPVNEIELMRACKHYILSFGGFGEMAAFLNSGAPIIIRPDKDNPKHWE